MINCPKCGADNMIGAIFCRTCGEKLNLDELTPEVFDAPAEAIGAKVGRVVQRLVTLVLVVGGVGLLGGMFWPAKLSHVGEIEQAASAKAGRKYQAVIRPSPRLPPQVPFSSDEAASIANKELGLPKTDAKTRKPMVMSIQFHEGGNCTFVLKSLLFSQVPLYATVVTKPTVSTAGSVDFNIVSTKIGKLPLPGGMRKIVMNQFKSLGAADVFGSAEQNITGVTIAADSCKIAVRR